MPSQDASAVLAAAGEFGPRLSCTEYQEIAGFARAHFGLDLKAGKEELVTARLSKKLRRGGFRSFRDYLNTAIADKTGRCLEELIDALTTNHTSFLREPAHFDLLRALSAAEFAAVPVLRVWSAACSTGEEPYSIAGCLTCGGDREPRRWEIRATDISTRVLETARRGVYANGSLKSLPAEWLPACFQRGRGRWDGYYRVRPEIAARIHFERVNLLDSGSGDGKWHVIFCRNVMIYFDKPTQQRVVARLAAALEPGGYLMIGHSESLTGIASGLEYVRPATYRNRSSSGKRSR